MKSKPAHDTKPAKKQGHLSRDDLHLWQQVKRTVEPLAGREQYYRDFLDRIEKSANNTDPQEAPLPKTDNSSSKPPVRKFPAAPYSPPVSRPANPGGITSAIDDKTAKKLLKGRVSIEDRIDLHGMTQDQAHRLLISFLGRCQASGKRMVLVITGKGRTTGGILREAVPHWLREPQLSQYVSAFRPAHITHGGDGALYVRLRRNDKGGAR